MNMVPEITLQELIIYEIHSLGFLIFVSRSTTNENHKINKAYPCNQPKEPMEMAFIQVMRDPSRFSSLSCNV
jgi:hypothetical protein